MSKENIVDNIHPQDLLYNFLKGNFDCLLANERLEYVRQGEREIRTQRDINLGLVDKICTIKEPGFRNFFKSRQTVAGIKSNFPNGEIPELKIIIYDTRYTEALQKIADKAQKYENNIKTSIVKYSD